MKALRVVSPKTAGLFLIHTFRVAARLCTCGCNFDSLTISPSICFASCPSNQLWKHACSLYAISMFINCNQRVHQMLNNDQHSHKFHPHSSLGLFLLSDNSRASMQTSHSSGAQQCKPQQVRCPSLETSEQLQGPAPMQISAASNNN